MLVANKHNDLSTPHQRTLFSRDGKLVEDTMSKLFENLDIASHQDQWLLLLANYVTMNAAGRSAEHLVWTEGFKSPDLKATISTYRQTAIEDVAHSYHSDDLGAALSQLNQVVQKLVYRNGDLSDPRTGAPNVRQIIQSSLKKQSLTDLEKFYIVDSLMSELRKNLSIPAFVKILNMLSSIPTTRTVAEFKASPAVVDQELEQEASQQGVFADTMVQDHIQVIEKEWTSTSLTDEQVSAKKDAYLTRQMALLGGWDGKSCLDQYWRTPAADKVSPESIRSLVMEGEKKLLLRLKGDAESVDLQVGQPLLTETLKKLAIVYHIDQQYLLGEMSEDITSLMKDVALTLVSTTSTTELA